MAAWGASRLFLRDLRDRLANSVVGSAAAEIAAQTAANLLRCGLRMFGKKRGTGDDESGRAVTALRSILIDEGLLHGMQVALLRQRFDRSNGFVLGFDREHRAGIHGLAFE